MNRGTNYFPQAALGRKSEEIKRIKRKKTEREKIKNVEDTIHSNRDKGVDRIKYKSQKHCI